MCSYPIILLALCRYFTGTVFFDKALFQDASLVENWEETHIIQSPAKTDSTPMPLLQLPIELLKHIFRYLGFLYIILFDTESFQLYLRS